MKVVIIHHDLDTAKDLEALLESWEGRETTVKVGVSGGSARGIYNNLPEDTDLFILGKDEIVVSRNRSKGTVRRARWAGGISQAIENLYPKGQRFLILSHGWEWESLQLDCLWDLSRKDSLIEAIKSCLEADLPTQNQINQLKESFSKELIKPDFH